MSSKSSPGCTSAIVCPYRSRSIQCTEQTKREDVIQSVELVKIRPVAKIAPRHAMWHRSTIITMVIWGRDVGSTSWWRVVANLR